MYNDENPLVSVVIPSYNHDIFIQDSIKSIIAQSYDNIELIIIDDGSTDQSVKKIKELVDICTRHFFRFEFRVRENKGIGATLNEALEWSQGKYWCICSSDDFYHKNKILSQVQFLKKNEEYKFCITKAYVVNDKDEKLIRQTEFYNFGLTNNISFADIFTFRIHLPVTAMYDMELVKYILNGFDSSLSAEDYDMNLRIAEKTDIGIINEKLYYYRSPEALGANRSRMPMRISVSESHLKTIQKYKDHSLYEEALLEWNFRRFIYFSAFIKTKKYSMYGMMLSLGKMNNILFYKALIRLVFYWRNV